MDHKTRPSMAKVRVEAYLTKPKLNAVWVGLDSFPVCTLLNWMWNWTLKLSPICFLTEALPFSN